MVSQAQLPIILYCDNNGAVTQSKNPRNHKGGNHIERKYHLIREIVRRWDVVVTKVVLADNQADPFTKALTFNIFQIHMVMMGVGCDIFWTLVQVGVYSELCAYMMVCMLLYIMRWYSLNYREIRYMYENEIFT